MTDLDPVRQLRANGATAEYHRAAVALAKDHPRDVGAQIEAAYACDGFGTEEEAITFYDAAWALGVPEAVRMEFLVGYGSTLRNVGRLPQAVDLLSQAVDAYPDYPALRAFLALALLDAGDSELAVIAMLDALLAVGSDRLDGYDRALAGYCDALRSRGDKR